MSSDPNGGILLTDDGYTIADLESTGMTFSTPHRRAHLQTILNGFGVRRNDGELQVVAIERDFPQKKHSLVQAILAVNDMFVIADAHVRSLFKEDVAALLERKQIPVFPEFKLSGKSGFDHRFDFGLPKTGRRPQRVLQAINNLTRDQALSFAFAVADVKAVRAESLDAYTFVNDGEHPPLQQVWGQGINLDRTLSGALPATRSRESCKCFMPLEASHRRFCRRVIDQSFFSFSRRVDQIAITA